MKDEEKRCENCIHNEEHLKAIQEGKRGSAICMLECNPSRICFEPIIKTKDEEMADKHAEEYFGKKTELVDVQKIGLYKDGFLAGLKAGRPQWHYVKDGVYPTDDKKVLCILGDFENDNLEVGYYSQVEGDSKRWRFENYDLPDDSEEGWGVSAWKEIVMPKESE